MNPGRLNERILIQRRERDPNLSGGNKVSWVDERTIWASVKNFDPDKAKIASIDTRKALYDVWVRKLEITADHRIIWRGRILEIDFIEDYLTGPPFYLILKCKEARIV